MTEKYSLVMQLLTKLYHSLLVQSTKVLKFTGQQKQVLVISQEKNVSLL